MRVFPFLSKHLPTKVLKRNDIKHETNQIWPNDMTELNLFFQVRLALWKSRTLVFRGNLKMTSSKKTKSLLQGRPRAVFGDWPPLMAVGWCKGWVGWVSNDSRGGKGATKCWLIWILRECRDCYSPGSIAVKNQTFIDVCVFRLLLWFSAG